MASFPCIFVIWFLFLASREVATLKLYGSSKKPLQISYICFSSLPFTLTSIVMTEHGHYPSCTILLKTTFVGTTFSLWLDTPYNLIVPSILTEGKILCRDTCELWIFYFSENLSVSMFVEWICMFNFDFTGSFRFWEDQAEIEIHCRCIYVFTPSCRFQLVKHRWW